MKLILHYLGTASVFFAIDMIWLGIIAKQIYQKYLGSLLRPEVNWAPAIAFYLIFIFGILVFAIYPGVEKNSLKHTVALGGLFGFISYATYDLTNWATLKDWPWEIVFIDLLWGTFICALVSLAGFYIVKAIG